MSAERQANITWDLSWDFRPSKIYYYFYFYLLKLISMYKYTFACLLLWCCFFFDFKSIRGSVFMFVECERGWLDSSGSIDISMPLTYPPSSNRFKVPYKVRKSVVTVINIMFFRQRRKSIEMATPKLNWNGRNIVLDKDTTHRSGLIILAWLRSVLKCIFFCRVATGVETLGTSIRIWVETRLHAVAFKGHSTS